MQLPSGVGLVLKITPYQALVIQKVVDEHNQHAPPPVDDALFTDHDIYEWHQWEYRLKFAIYQLLRKWYSPKVADDFYNANQVYVQIVFPVVSHRIRWYAKLMFPAINTLTTTFQFVNSMEWVLVKPSKYDNPRAFWNLDPDEPMKTMEYEHLRLVKSTIKTRDKRTIMFSAAYSEALDTCLIYRPEAEIPTRTLNPLFYLDHRFDARSFVEQKNQEDKP